MLRDSQPRKVTSKSHYVFKGESSGPCLETFMSGKIFVIVQVFKRARVKHIKCRVSYKCLSLSVG